MKRLKKLSTHRLRDFDYSQPAVHHVLLETKGGAEILGTCTDGVTTLSDAGREFLEVLGMALQNFPCVRIDGMDIQPSTVELTLAITERRNAREVPPVGTDEWKHYRRVMTLPVIVGYLKMNSGLRINRLLGRSGEEVWTRRYRSRVLSEPEEIDALNAVLRERWGRVAILPPRASSGKQRSTIAAEFAAALGITGTERELSVSLAAFPELLSETMILGRVLLLTGARQEVSRSERTLSGIAAHAGRSGKFDSLRPLIRSVGPGRIFLSG